MLGNVKRYSRIYLAYGYTDLRFGIDGLARVIQDHFSLDPFQKAAFSVLRQEDRPHQRTFMGRRRLRACL